MFKKKVIGITGAFSSGKTTASMFLADKGATIIDADKIAHILLGRNEKIKSSLRKRFGDKIMSNNKISREKLRNIVFNDKESLQFLNNLMHPLILEEIEKKAIEAVSRVVVIDAPLLFETGLEGIVDLSVVVFSDKETIIERSAKKGFTREQVILILESQMSLGEKKKKADFIIENNGGMEKIKKGVEELWKRIQGL